MEQEIVRMLAEYAGTLSLYGGSDSFGNSMVCECAYQYVGRSKTKGEVSRRDLRRIIWAYL